MQKIKLSLIGMALLLITLQSSCWARDVNIKGDISYDLIYFTENGEFDSNVIQYELSLEKYFEGKGKAYLSFKGGYDSMEKIASGEAPKLKIIELNEAFADIYLKNTDLRIGRQVISWGTADGINPTNYINPKEISFADMEPKGKPLTCARATYYGKNIILTGVGIFDYEPLEIPEEMKKIPFLLGYLEEFEDPTDEPENTLKNMEFALKIEKRISNCDVKLSYFSGWEDYPALWIKPIPPGFTVTLSPQSAYQRVNKIGLATASTFKGIGLWTETAYVLPREIEEMEQLGNILFSMNEPYFQSVAGANYTFGNDIYLEGQYIYYGNGSLISPYVQHTAGEKVDSGKYLMVHSSWTLDQIHTLGLTGIDTLQDNSFILMPQYTYAINQVTDLSLKAVLFFGDAGTEFGGLKDKSLIDLSAKISF